MNEPKRVLLPLTITFQTGLLDDAGEITLEQPQSFNVPCKAQAVAEMITRVRNEVGCPETTPQSDPGDEQ